MPIDNETIENAMAEPAKAQQDGRLAEQHRITDQLEVQRALASDQAADAQVQHNGRRFTTHGLRVSTLYPLD